MPLSRKLAVPPLLCLCLSVPTFPGAEPTEGPDTAWKRITAHADHDLTRLPASEFDQLFSDLNDVLPKRHGLFLPSHLWRLNDGYTLLEIGGRRFVPGSTNVRVTEFDAAGKVVLETTFDTGWRCWVSSVNRTRAGTIVFNTEIGLPGRASEFSQRQYYAKIGSRYDLVRMEDSEGAAIRNDYSVVHFRRGPQVPNQTVKDWLVDLGSKDRWKVLRALVWLGGHHLKPNSAKPADHDEDPLEVKRVQELRANAEVRERLKVLVASKDRWVREAAELALHPGK